jgi:hypothetical protein
MEEVKREPRDNSRVNVNDDAELDYWTRRFDVSEQRLKAAVQKVGVIIDDVARELKGTASGGQSDG